MKIIKLQTCWEPFSLLYSKRFIQNLPKGATERSFSCYGTKNPWWTPVAMFWLMVASKPLWDLEINVSRLPVTLSLNNQSSLGSTLIKKLLAGLRAMKKLIATCWTTPRSISRQVWLLMYQDIMYLELSTAWVPRGKDCLSLTLSLMWRISTVKIITHNITPLVATEKHWLSFWICSASKLVLS